jgi:hypothetical protein
VPDLPIFHRQETRIATSRLSALVYQPMSEPDPLKKHFDILDRYQAFSTELSRIALLGVAAVGYLITSSTCKLEPGAVRLIQIETPSTKIALWLSAVLLSVSAGLALFHRYYSTDSMASMIRAQHLINKAAEGLPAAAVEAELEERNRRFKRSGWMLALSSIALCSGAASLAIAFLLSIRAPGMDGPLPTPNQTIQRTAPRSDA